MLKSDPALRSRVRAAAERATRIRADPNARLDFFYRRHSAWDERYNLYPVYRVDAAP